MLTNYERATSLLLILGSINSLGTSNGLALPVESMKVHLMLTMLGVTIWRVTLRSGKTPYVFYNVNSTLGAVRSTSAPSGNMY